MFHSSSFCRAAVVLVCALMISGCAGLRDRVKPSGSGSSSGSGEVIIPMESTAEEESLVVSELPIETRELVLPGESETPAKKAIASKPVGKSSGTSKAVAATKKTQVSSSKPGSGKKASTTAASAKTSKAPAASSKSQAASKKSVKQTPSKSTRSQTPVKSTKK